MQVAVLVGRKKGKTMHPLTTKACVYILIDCRDGRPFYVGLTVNVAFRMRQHCTSPIMSNERNLATSGTRESRKILSEGGTVFMLEVFHGCVSIAAKHEKLFITMMRLAGVNIVNKRSGSNKGRFTQIGKPVRSKLTGISYNSRHDAAQAENVCSQSIANYIKKGWYEEIEISQSPSMIDACRKNGFKKIQKGSQ